MRKRKWPRASRPQRRRSLGCFQRSGPYFRPAHHSKQVEKKSIISTIVRSRRRRFFWLQRRLLRSTPGSWLHSSMERQPLNFMAPRKMRRRSFR